MHTSPQPQPCIPQHAVESQGGRLWYTYVVYKAVAVAKYVYMSICIYIYIYLVYLVFILRHSHSLVYHSFFLYSPQPLPLTFFSYP